MEQQQVPVAPMTIAIPALPWGSEPYNIEGTGFKRELINGEHEWWVQLGFLFKNGEVRGIPMNLTMAKDLRNFLSNVILECDSGLIVPEIRVVGNGK